MIVKVVLWEVRNPSVDDVGSSEMSNRKRHFRQLRDPISLETSLDCVEARYPTVHSEDTE